jgi:hypothetical protein
VLYTEKRNTGFEVKRNKERKKEKMIINKWENKG